MSTSEKNKVLQVKEIPMKSTIDPVGMPPKKKVVFKKKLTTKNRRSHKQTPMATLEMVLTTKEFQKIEQLPKLPTDKNEKKLLERPVADITPITINLPKPLPKCITVKPVNTWKAHVDNLRKTVEEKLKETKESEVKENVQQNANPTQLCGVAQATQTAYRGFKTCGLIQRSKRDETFSLTCFNCAAVYDLADWQHYMAHIDKVHKFEKKNKIRTPKAKAKNIVEICTSLAACDTNTTSVEEINGIVECSDLNLADVDVSNTIVMDIDLDSTLIKNFKIREHSGEFEDDNESNLSSESENSTTQNAGVVDFYMTDSARNLRFLKILHAHPLLWHSRRYGPSTFDAEAEEFLKKFDNTMAIADFHSSLINARELYRRFSTLTSAKMAKLDKEPQLKKYVNLLNDIVTLSKSFAYNCDSCSFYFLNKNDLLKHKFKKHKIGDVSHVCSCGLHFADSEGKEAHEATHNTEPNFTCEHCGLLFFSQKKLQNHILLSHPDVVPNPQPYQCPKCDERFAQQYMLKWHVLKHDPPKYKCETCGKSYRKAFDYKHHMKAHLNQRDFICEDCGKAYIGKGMLRKHRFKVHKAGKHVCLPCKTYFANFENLHAHMQKFHPDGSNLDRKKKQHAAHVKKYHDRLKAERPCGPGRKPPDLKCKECGMEFGRIGELRQHKRVFGHYLGDRRFKCPHCESILNSDQTFVMHLRKMHHLNTKYSDVKYFQPYTDYSEECIEITTEDIDTNVQYDDTYEEVDYAVHNINYTDNESDIRRSIVTDAVANYEEVQYSIPSDDEKSEYLHEYHSNFRIENENIHL